MEELKTIAKNAAEEQKALNQEATEDKKDELLLEATQKELSVFAETVKRLCDDRIIPRSMPVQVINALWDKYMAESVTIKGFLENVEKETNIGQGITLDEVKRVGYGVLNKVVNEYTRPCLCKTVVEEAHKYGGNPLEIAGFKLREAGILTQCAVRTAFQCGFAGGMMTVPTPWGKITVNLQHGVVANRDVEGGAVDIDQKTGLVVFSQNEQGVGGSGPGHNNGGSGGKGSNGSNGSGGNGGSGNKDGGHGGKDGNGNNNNGQKGGNNGNKDGGKNKGDKGAENGNKGGNTGGNAANVGAQLNPKKAENPKGAGANIKGTPGTGNNKPVFQRIIQRPVEAAGGNGGGIFAGGRGPMKRQR
jgi:hypothetical protein